MPHEEKLKRGFLNSKMKKYVRFLEQLAKIDKKATLYLLTLSRQEKKDIFFEYGGDLICLFTWDSTPQRQAYWESINNKLLKRKQKETTTA